MAITPAAGYMIDPNNPNGVVKIGDINSATGIAYGNVPTAVPGNVVTGTTSSLQQSPSGGATAPATVVPYNNNNATQTTAISPNTIGPGNILPTTSPTTTATSNSVSTSIDLTPVGGNGSQVVANAIPLSRFSGYNLQNGNDFTYNGHKYQVNGGYVIPDSSYPGPAPDLSTFAPQTQASTTQTITQPTTAATQTNTTQPATQPATQPGTQVTQPGVTQPTTQNTAQTNINIPNVALQPGNTGDNVKALQDYLVSQGLMTQDQVNTGYGTYGPQTTAAVQALQQKLGVDNSSGPGYFGPKTIAALQAQNASTGGQTQTNGSGLTVGGAAPATSPTGASDPYAGLDPIAKQVKMYTDAATALGLPTIKQQYDKTLQDQADLTNKMNDEIAKVRNNPWYSQGIADKEVQKIQDKYKTQLDTLTHLETLYDSMYKTGQAQVENIVSGAQADIKATNDLAQKQLDAASALAKDNQVVTIGNQEVLINKATGKQVAVLGPSAASVKPAGGSGTSNQTIDNERALFNQFNGEPIVKDYNTILAKKLSVDKILSSKLGGPGDLAVVYEFMKGLDPTSVVRETEYDTAAKSGNIFAGAFAKFNGYLSPNGGFLPDSVKSSFQSIVNSKLQVQQQLYDNVAKQYQAIAGRQGLNPENVTVNYSAANTGNNSSSSSQSKFSDVQSSITFKDKTAYIPRSVWAGVSDKDGLLQEAKNDGYTLLIND